MFICYYLVVLYLIILNRSWLYNCILYSSLFYSRVDQKQEEALRHVQLEVSLPGGRGQRATPTNRGSGGGWAEQALVKPRVTQLWLNTMVHVWVCSEIYRYSTSDSTAITKRVLSKRDKKVWLIRLLIQWETHNVEIHRMNVLFLFCLWKMELLGLYFVSNLSTLLLLLKCYWKPL